MKAEQPNVIQSVMTEVIEPGIQRLLEGRYFTELREGRLSRRRIQAWALQHYLYNITIAKGQVICMFKYAHDPELYGALRRNLQKSSSIRIWSSALARPWG
jgi:thiaminase